MKKYDLIACLIYLILGIGNVTILYYLVDIDAPWWTRVGIFITLLFLVLNCAIFFTRWWDKGFERVK